MAQLGCNRSFVSAHHHELRFIGAMDIQNGDTTVNLYFYYYNGQWQPLNPWLPSASNIYYNSGNVGVGTTSLRGKFDVDGPGDIYLSDDPFARTNQSLYNRTE